MVQSIPNRDTKSHRNMPETHQKFANGSIGNNFFFSPSSKLHCRCMCMHALVCVDVRVSACVWVCIWRSEVNLQYYSLGVIPLDFILRRISHRPVAHWFGEPSWPVSPSLSFYCWPHKHWCHVHHFTWPSRIKLRSSCLYSRLSHLAVPNNRTGLLEQYNTNILETMIF